MQQPTNMRSAIFNEPRVFGGQYSLNTPSGNVNTNQAPPIPPRLNSQMNNGYGGMNNRYGYSSMGYGGGAYGSYGGSSPYGYGGYNSMFNNLGCSGYGGYGGSTTMGYNQNPENRFIQLAEESSRPAFQNIESLVGAIGNIANMLDSTFFALTNSFRAILGVASNFAHLRGVFAQVWSSFALFRLLTWLYRKMIYLLGFSNSNPSLQTFKQAFHHAEQGSDGLIQKQQKGSSMPVLVFLGFIMTAPYLLMKFLGNSIESGTKNPRNWVKPLEGTVSFNFQGANANELTIKPGQKILIAPKAVQEEQNLLNSGWALASVDGEISGLIPINYVQRKNKIETKDSKAAPKEDIVDVEELL